MQQVCQKFVMDMTDARMGPEQRCRNCQFAKKEHISTQSQGQPQGPAVGKVSDLAKKFSAGNQPIAPDPSVQQKFKDSVKNSVQMKNSQNIMHKSQETQQSKNQTQNLQQQDETPFKKSESVIINKEPEKIEIKYERQNVQIVNSQENNQGNQSLTYSQKVQIPTEPQVQKIIAQPIIKPDTQTQKPNEQLISKPQENVEKQEIQQIKKPDDLQIQKPQEQLIIQQVQKNKETISEITPSPNKLTNNPFLKKDQNVKNTASLITPEKSSPITNNPQDNGNKPLSFVQQQKLLREQQQQQQQQQTQQFGQFKPNQFQKSEIPSQQNPKPQVKITIQEENKEGIKKIDNIQNGTKSQDSNKEQVHLQTKEQSNEKPNVAPKLTPSTIKGMGNNLPLPVFGFGPPPVKKPSEQKESESILEQQILDRPVLASKHKRTHEAFE